MPFTGPVEDRLLIRDLYGRYADASWRGARQDWLDCWTEDARWNSHLFQCRGKIALGNQWDQLWAGFSELAFLSEIGSIEVTGDSARARSCAREIIRLKTGGLYKLVGAYEDQLLRENGEWRFSCRDYRPLIEELPA
jgi:SnoaL-like domain